MNSSTELTRSVTEVAYAPFQAMFWISRLVLPVSVFTGLPGNILIIAVFSRSLCGTSPTARMYYIVMSIADELLLLFQHLPEFLGIGLTMLNSATWLPVNNMLICGVFRYIWLSSESVANCTLMFFCIERLYVVMNPLKAKTFVRYKRALWAVLLMSFVSFAYLSAAVFVFSSVSIGPYKLCVAANSQLGLIIVTIGHVFGLVGPTFVEALCAIILSVYLALTSKSRLTLRGETESSKGASASQLSATLTIIIIALISVSTYFVHTFFYAFFVYGNAANVIGGATALRLATLDLCSIPRFTNFFVLLWRMQPFRDELRRLCSRKA